MLLKLYRNLNKKIEILKNQINEGKGSKSPAGLLEPRRLLKAFYLLIFDSLEFFLIVFKKPESAPTADKSQFARISLRGFKNRFHFYTSDRTPSQKRRLFVSTSFSSLVAAFLIITMLASVAPINVPYAQAATYYWTQSGWTTLDTDDTADHDNNKTDWVKYSAVDSGIVAGTDLTLGTVSGSFADDTVAEYDHDSSSGYANTASSDLTPYVGLSKAAANADEYESSGTYTSKVFDGGVTPTWNSIAWTPESNLGTGADGDQSALSGTVNTYAYVSTATINADSLVAITVDSSTGFSVDDEVLIIQMQRSSGAGTYEFANISTVTDGTNLTLDSLTNTYYSGAPNQENATVTQIVRVPQYGDVTISGTVTAATWNGSKGGIVIFRATGTVTVSGSIDASGKGYRGAAAPVGDDYIAFKGESNIGSGVLTTANASANGMGGGGSIRAANRDAPGGGGGGYASAGADGICGTCGTGTVGAGGLAGGSASLSEILSGGGGGAGDGVNDGGAAGGAGGGIIFISAETISVSGNILAQGATGSAGTGVLNDDGAGGGGAGAGGSVYLLGNTLSLGSSKVNASGGTGGAGEPTQDGGEGGNGSVGRIRLDYGSLSGTTSPAVGYEAGLGNIKFKVRSSNISAADVANQQFVGPTTGDFYITSGTTTLATVGTDFVVTDQYVQYRTYLGGNSANTITPTFEDATLTYNTSSTFIDNTRSEFDSGTYSTAAYYGDELRLSGSAGSYPTSGTNTYTSQAYDAGELVKWNTLSWVEGIEDALSTVDIQMQVSTDGSTWTNASGVEGQFITSSPASLSLSAISQTLYYKATLSTTDANYTPKFYGATLSHSGYSSSATLTSSAYDSTDAANVIGAVTWNATGTSATETVKIQVKTASSEAGLSSASWCGPVDCSGSDYFTTYTGDDITNTALTSGGDDRWVQYKVFLASDTTATPTLVDVTVTYVVNAAPNFNNDFPTTSAGGVSAIQVSTANYASLGLTANDVSKVYIQYSVRDIDTTTGTNTSGYVTPSFRYSTDGGSGWTNITSSYFTTADDDTGTDGIQQSVDTTTPPNSIIYTTHTALWDAKAQEDAIYTADQAMIEVTVDDNEPANGNVIQNSAAFALDTRDPELADSVYTGSETAPTIYVDASTNTPTLTLNTRDDDAAFQMMIDTSSDFSGGSWATYSSSPTFSASDPSTIYIKFKDKYNNTTAEDGSISVTTPETPTGLMIQDTSNLTLAAPEYGLFLAWKTADTAVPAFAKYQVLRSTASDGVYSQVGSDITPIETNYYRDNTVTFDANFYYKVRMEDASGNVSFFSTIVNGKANGVQDAGEGGGGSETTAPVISAITEAETTTQSTTITWTTDELADSKVEYSEDASYSSSVSSSGFTTSHSITVTGLNANTTYNYRVVSVDPSSNSTTSSSGTIQTQNGAKITASSVQITDITNDSALISWSTDTASSSYVTYATSAANLNSDTDTTTVSDDTTTTSNSVTIPSPTLSQGVTYYFYVKSSSDSGTTWGKDYNITNGAKDYYSFTTTNDSTAPTISAISTVPAAEQATIIWTTDEQATSRVKYWLASADESLDTEPTAVTAQTAWTTRDTDFETSHSFVISGLTENTAYKFRVVSRDASLNSATSPATGSDPSTFTTIKIDDDAPVITFDLITGITNKTTQSATISWTTADDLSNSVIEYGTAAGITCSSSANNYTSSKTSATYTNSHSATISGLTSATTYYFCLKSTDPAANTGIAYLDGATPYSFTTSSGPQITSVSSGAPDESSTTITWTTNVASSSYVYYTTDSNLDSSSPSSARPIALLVFNNADAEDMSTSHSITLSNLTKSTKYYFFVKSTNATSESATDDNLSSNYTFTTTPDTVDPVISSITDSATTDTCIITWTTDEPTTSQISYGTTVEYGSTTTLDTDYETSHSVTLTGLNPDTTYYYKVSSTDNAATPRTATSVDGDLAVTCATEADTSSTSCGSSTRWDASLQKCVGSGGGGFPPPKPTPIIDTTPPRITKVNSIVTTEGIKVTWQTNEVSDSFVEYGADANYEAIGLGKRDDAALAHTIALPLMNFTAKTTYHYRVSSRDKAGNLGRSKDFTFNIVTKEQQDIVETVKAAEEKKAEPTRQMVNAAREFVQNYFQKITINRATREQQVSTLLEEAQEFVPPPMLMSNQPEVSTTATTAIIRWETDTDSNSIVDYIEAARYDSSNPNFGYQTGDFDTYTTKHEVIVPNLKTNTAYYMRLRSKNRLGAEAISEKFLITTKEESLKVLNSSIYISETSLTIDWTTNVPSDSLVFYTPVKQGVKQTKDSQSKGDPQKTIIHSIVIDNLKMDTTYALAVGGTSNKGETISVEIGNKRTAADVQAPTISQIKVDQAMYPKLNKVQSNISWLTNELSTSKVIYWQGIEKPDDEDEIQVKESRDFDTRHIITLTTLKPGAVYTIRVESEDAAGQIATSKATAIITPKQQQGVVQLIIKNIEEIFGFGRR